MKLIYPSKVIITKRPGNIPAKKHNNVVYAREDFVNDLVFPLIVQSKTQEIFARDEVKKFVYYQGGRVPFNQKEISALENVLKQVMCDDYSIRSMPSSH
ncbi:hypothetical protein HERIO_1265 [Hepatospora eriocheir]|nr:hypothetical protein HERIO_1265 [Hepatospora eriocheir]